jgi:hypothetical protein
MVSFEMGSNIKCESERQSAKHEAAIVLIVDGIQMD